MVESQSTCASVASQGLDAMTIEGEFVGIVGLSPLPPTKPSQMEKGVGTIGIFPSMECAYYHA